MGLLILFNNLQGQTADPAAGPLLVRAVSGRLKLPKVVNVRVLV